MADFDRVSNPREMIAATMAVAAAPASSGRAAYAREARFQSKSDLVKAVEQ